MYCPNPGNCFIESHNHGHKPRGGLMGRKVDAEGQPESREVVKPEQPTIKLDVTKEPATIEVKVETIAVVNGPTLKDQTLCLKPGTYVVNEVLKTLFIRGQYGKMEKFEKRKMIIAERTF